MLCLAIFLAAAASAFAQTVWKWTDEKGIVHYSDQPGPGAVEVNINAVQTYSADEANPRVDTTTKPATKQPAASAYRALNIASPVAEETIQGTGGQVSVRLSLEPGLQPGHSVQLFMDGKLVGDEHSTSLSYSLPEVDRGEHTLQARVVARDGATLIVSPSVTFYVRIPSVFKPAH